MLQNKKNIVVIGGGTGTYTVLKGLKEFTDLDLTAIVTMTDSGGSTGRLRDELGQLPVGDLRACLTALADEGESEELLRKLFLYRFPDLKNNSNVSSLAGHNFGNLFLSALTDILGSELEAVRAASKILNISGKVLPVTTDNANLVAEYENGEILFGESSIDVPPTEHDHTAKLKRLWTQPETQILPETDDSIKSADLIVIGPGDLYSSLLSNWVVSGMPQALKSSKARLIYISNLFSRFGQTHNLKLSDYISEINKYIGKNPDYVLINNSDIPQDGIDYYATENSFLIEDNLIDGENSIKIIRTDLLNNEYIKQNDSDKINRSLIRHDSHKLAKSIYNLLNE